MKSNTTFIFAGIMSAIIGNAFATGENIVTSKSYVDAQDALKQDIITTSSVTIGDGGKLAVPLSSFVTSDGSGGVSGNTVGLLQSDSLDGIPWWNAALHQNEDNAVPSVQAVSDMYTDVVNLIGSKQTMISVSGYDGSNAYSNDNNGWLKPGVKGTGLVTKTAAGGVVGERKIFEATDVSGYHAQALSQNEKDIQDISIPTVGAMMTAISNGVNAATPTGTPNTIANYGANGELDSGIATYTGAAAYNATNDSAKIPTMAGVTTYAQAKMTCAGWPESVPVNQRTDENCWLWNKN